MEFRGHDLPGSYPMLPFSKENHMTRYSILSTRHGESCLMAAGLLALALVGAADGQQPGTKQKADAPKTREEKLKQSRDAYQDSIDWSNVTIAPGEVDQ